MRKEQRQVVLVEADDTGLERSIQSIYRRMYLELLEMEDLEIIEMIYRARQDGDRIRKLVKVILKDSNGQTLWDALKQVADKAEGEGEISLHKTRGLELRSLRNIAECVFSNTEEKVTIFTDRLEENKKRERSTYSVIVGRQGLPYKDVLKGTKDSVKENDISGAISSIRGTREGKVLVKIS